MSKLPNIKESIFTTMSVLSNKSNAINLAQGFPNFDIDNQLKESFRESIEQDVHQYAHSSGNALLLEEIAKLTLNQYQRVVSPKSNVLVTAGATQALHSIITAHVKTNDEVIILDPAYDSYDPCIRLAGGTPVHVALNAALLPDWNIVEDKINSKTKMLIINNPHNPTGRVWDAKIMSDLVALLKKHPNVLLLSDEVYEYITFEQKHISVNTLTALHDRSFVVSSFGKTFHITGWKMGYVIASDELLNEVKKLHQFVVFSVNNMAQYALANYLKKVDVNKLGDFYQQKRDLFRKLMSETKFSLLPCEGTYFQAVDYSNYSKTDDLSFCKELVEEVGVAAIPFSPFYQQDVNQHIIRFCFAKDDNTLIKATELLCKI